jgi:membrane-associated phospholipid phosphatase
MPSPSLATRRSTPISSQQTAQPLSRVVWTMIFAMALAVWISFAALGLRIDFSSNPVLMAVAVIYAAAAFFYLRIRGDRQISDMLVVVAQLFLTLLLGLLLTYAASAVALPYCDAQLQAIDLWFGFHRPSYRNAIDSIPSLGAILDAAYLSIQPQTALVPLVLLLVRQLPRLQCFVLTLGVSLIATTLVAAFIPAVDAAIYVDLAPRGVAALEPGTYTHVRTLEGLRSGGMSVIRLDDLEGLITFPSFHTTNAILFVWALWPVRYLRTLILALNALMIASTPTAGSHYFIDIVGGTGVAVLAIATANWCKRVFAASGRDVEIKGPRYAEKPTQLVD